jgi:hypothetical protein
VDFAGANLQGDIRQHRILAVAFGDAFHLQYVFRSQSFSSFFNFAITNGKPTRFKNPKRVGIFSLWVVRFSDYR